MPLREVVETDQGAADREEHLVTDGATVTADHLPPSGLGSAADVRDDQVTAAGSIAARTEFNGTIVANVCD